MSNDSHHDKSDDASNSAEASADTETAPDSVSERIPDPLPDPLHNVGHWPTRWAARRGDQPAIADDERSLDWSAFDARISRLAGALHERGVEWGDRVGILLGNRVAFLELVFASARIGAICLPINLRLAPREIAFLLDDARPSALFFEIADTAKVSAACDHADHTPPQLVPVGTAASEGHERDDYEALLAAAAPCTESLALLPDDPMMLMYTSGTTGEPKGALLPHRKALYNSLNAEIYFDIRPDDRVLVVAPLFHSLGLQILALPLLHCGGSLLLQRRFDPERVWETVEREHIRYFGGVPAMHQRLHDALSTAGERYDLSSLRFVFTAGSAVSIELIRAFEAHGLVLKQGYGQTETSILCCLEAADAVRKAGSVGLPVRHLRLRIVTRESRSLPPAEWRDAAEGETGEIVVRGPVTMLGYWGRPEASRETLVDGWVWTGDLATRDDEGYVTLVGRSREMIISGGENVYPAEVEAAYREYPAIREIAVVGVPDPDWGEVGRAHIVLQPGRQLDRAALDTWARDRLASFKIPRHFVVEDALPHTASGKVQKHRLIER